MKDAKASFDHAADRPGSEHIRWGDEFRSARGISYSSAYGGIWIASHYDDIRMICSDAQTFISGEGITIPPLKNPVPVLPAESDGKMHTYYRSVLIPFLTPKAILSYETRIRGIVVKALDAMMEQDTCDAVSDFAAIIPTGAVGIVFGFSDEDTMRFDHDITAVVRSAGRNHEIQKVAVDRLMSFLLEKISERRGEVDRNDFVSTMLNYDAGGRKFTEEECVGLLWAAGGAAIDTTKHAIGHAIHEIGKRDDIRRVLIEDKAKIPHFVDELLRFHAPAQVLSRTVAKKVSIGGVDMKPGDRVLLAYGWANRDESAFSCPHQFKMDREPNQHLTFGYGLHQCVGKHLARLEIKIAIEEVLQRIPDYELIDKQQEPQLLGGLMWCYDSLPIRLPQKTLSKT